MGFWSIGLNTAFAFVSVSVGPIAPASTSPPSPTQPPPTHAARRSDADRPHTTADELLKALQRTKPVHDLVTPTSGPLSGTKTPPHTLLPEGTAIVDWEGHLTKTDDWWTFVTESPNNQPPTKILPNIKLEIMTRSLAGKTKPIRFSISGEVTTFQGENYLLARIIRRVVPTSNPPPAATTTEAIERKKTKTAVGDNPPPAEDVIAIMQGRNPRTVVSPTTQPGALRSVADLPGPSVKPDGSAFAQRPGRITHDNRWWNLTFETDHPDSDEPMIKLLPSRGLELMIRLARQAPDGLVLLVSGELTQYRGENYLLPRSVLRRSGADNLRK